MVDINKLQHSSKHNYQQIYLNGSKTCPNGTTTSIPHGLGYVPYVRLWAEEIAGELCTPTVASMTTVWHYDYEPASVSPIWELSVDSNFLNVSVSGGAMKVYYRIYIDAS